MACWPLGHQAIACIVVLFSQNAVTYLPEIIGWKIVANEDREIVYTTKNTQY